MSGKEEDASVSSTKMILAQPFTVQTSRDASVFSQHDNLKTIDKLQ